MSRLNDSSYLQLPHHPVGTSYFVSSTVEFVIVHASLFAFHTQLYLYLSHHSMGPVLSLLLYLIMYTYLSSLLHSVILIPSFTCVSVILVSYYLNIAFTFCLSHSSVFLTFLRFRSPVIWLSHVLPHPSCGVVHVCTQSVRVLFA